MNEFYLSDIIKNQANDNFVYLMLRKSLFEFLTNIITLSMMTL